MMSLRLISLLRLCQALMLSPWRLALSRLWRCFLERHTTYQIPRLFMWFLGGISFLSFFLLSGHSPVFADASTPTPTQTATGQAIPIIRTATPVPSGYYDCPALPPQGWGTVTPDPVWSLRCGHCSYASTPTASTATPTQSLTVTPSPDDYYVHWGDWVRWIKDDDGWYMIDQDRYQLACPDGDIVGVLAQSDGSVGYSPFGWNDSFLRARLRRDGDTSSTWGVLTIGYPNNPCTSPDDGTRCQTGWSEWSRAVDDNARAWLSSHGYPLDTGSYIPAGIDYIILNTWLNMQRVDLYQRAGLLCYGQSPNPARDYQVTYDAESTSGSVMLSCGEGDQVTGMMAGVAVQGGGIVAQMYGATDILDTGYAPLLAARHDCTSMECAGLDYESNRPDLYPYARQSSVVSVSPVIMRWYRSSPLQGVHNGVLHCYGTGQGSVTNLESYCSVIDPGQSIDPILPDPYYVDQSCVDIPSVTVGDWSSPPINICARVISFGSLSVLGYSINLDLLSRFMAVVFALFLILRG